MLGRRLVLGRLVLGLEMALPRPGVVAPLAGQEAMRCSGRPCPCSKPHRPQTKATTAVLAAEVMVLATGAKPPASEEAAAQHQQQQQRRQWQQQRRRREQRQLWRSKRLHPGP